MVKLGIVVARFNSLITDKLLTGCLDALMQHQIADKNITVVKVPGAFEIPVTAKTLLENQKVSAVIGLGCVIRGATPHFDYVCSESARGLSSLALQSGKPVINGILTCDTVEQAMDRAGIKAGNKGTDAALAALEMISVMNQLGV
ncbi:MAG: 6,7-dimethyl-8-ribityllumazine synthase [Arenicellales bacterium WSBS_2016_MAG_OTU3]